MVHEPQLEAERMKSPQVEHSSHRAYNLLRMREDHRLIVLHMDCCATFPSPLCIIAPYSHLYAARLQSFSQRQSTSLAGLHCLTGWHLRRRPASKRGCRSFFGCHKCPTQPGLAPVQLWTVRQVGQHICRQANTADGCGCAGRALRPCRCAGRQPFRRGARHEGGRRDWAGTLLIPDQVGDQILHRETMCA